MRTITFKIKNNSNPEYIEQKLKAFAQCTRFIYKKIEESSDKRLILYCKKRWSLNDIEIRSIVSSATQIKNSFNSKIKDSEEKIQILKTERDGIIGKIYKVKCKKTTENRLNTVKKLKKTLFKINTKIARMDSFLKSDIVFGSRKLLKEISYLSNNKEVNLTTIVEKKIEYTAKRNGYITIIGEANQKGNRFFDFDLPNKTIFYKPIKGVKIELSLSNRKDKFEKEIQQAIENKLLSVTVSLNNQSFSLSYDEATLCGFAINKIERKKDVYEATKYCTDSVERKKIINSVYRDYYDRVKQRQFSDKISNRLLGIDLNPEHIGYSIVDLLPNNKVKVIEIGSFNFKKIMKRSGLYSGHPETIYRNNKRKHERKEVVCHLFKLMKHYKVGSFVMEDLNFKSKNDSFGNDFNRKTKNIWDRDLLSGLINKKCTEGGYQLINVNPVYTSLIGNLSYQVFDPVAASLEIVRRGATKYESGQFYPQRDSSTIHTMEAVAKRNRIDVGLIRDASWADVYTILNSNVKFRYRWGEKVGATFSYSLKSYKSKTKRTLYCL